MAKKTATKQKKPRPSNTGYGKSGRKSTLKNAAKDLKPKSKEEIKDIMAKKLSPAEEKFCQLYVSDVEFYGNGTQSYIEAFNVEIIRGTNKKNVPQGKKGMTIEAVRSAASYLLTQSHILNRIDELLEEGGFNDQHADKTLQFLMTQRADLRVALGATEAYNKLQQRIHEKSSVFHSFAGEDIPDEELDRIIEEQNKFLTKKK